MELVDAGPRVESVAHRVLSPQTEIFSTSEEVDFVELLVQVLPVECVGHPGEAIGHIEESESKLPAHTERVAEENVPGEGNQTVVHDVRVLEIDGRVFDVIARVEQKLTLTVELDCLGGLVDLIGALKVLGGTLGEFDLGGVHDLVEIVYLSEVTHLRCGKESLRLRHLLMLHGAEASASHLGQHCFS